VSPLVIHSRTVHLYTGRITLVKWDQHRPKWTWCSAKSWPKTQSEIDISPFLKTQKPSSSLLSIILKIASTLVTGPRSEHEFTESNLFQMNTVYNENVPQKWWIKKKRGVPKSGTYEIWRRLLIIFNFDHPRHTLQNCSLIYRTNNVGKMGS
jgi:hypothetical protein